MIGRNDICWCGSGQKWKKCHYPNESSPQRKSKESTREEYLRQHRIIIKDQKQIDGIRASCHLASRILEAACAKAKVGVTTQELNDYAHKLHDAAGAIPAPLNYGHPPFPKSICTSLNDVICHGIPNEIPLKEGDILNIDVTCILNGYYGDCSAMVMIGEVDAEKRLVVDVSYNCLMRAIEIIKPGIAISAIGDVIENYAHSKNCSVVYQFVGHGVGINFHEGPQISHHRNYNSILLVPGMTFTIEPMINAGSREAIIDPIDQWTARTKDGKASAQWEHTLLVTEDGHEILTNWKR
ncbi:MULTISPECIES: methionyl aminopeptidase [Candidatus Protochlamydia]|nr:MULTISPECIES: methionyl aminopeptidase [Protochlamydia]